MRAVVRYGLPGLLCILVSGHVVAEDAAGTKPTVPTWVRTALEPVFDAHLKRERSGWEQASAEGKLVYDTSPLLKGAKTPHEAAWLFAIAPTWTELAVDQLASRKLRWEDLSIIQRHRFVDYLLHVDGGGPYYGLKTPQGYFKSRRPAKRLRRYADQVRPVDDDRDGNAVFVMAQPELYVEVFLKARSPSGPISSKQGWLAKVTPKEVALDYFDNRWKAAGWSSPDLEGVTLRDIAVDTSGRTVYGVLRRPVWNTTRLPSMLLRVKDLRATPVALPTSGVLNCVAMSADGRAVYVGTEAGEVLRREDDGPWRVDEVFRDDALHEIAMVAGGTVAVSRRGGAA